MSDSFFTSIDNEWFQPTPHTRGPWDEHACHAGPPTGLVARALQKLLPAQRLTRLTVNLQRPVPYAGFRIEATVTRNGRTVSLSEARLIDGEDKVVITAAGMHLSSVELSGIPTYQQHFGTADEAHAGEFPLKDTLHDKPAFNGDGVRIRYPDGQTPLPGPTTAWVKTLPLLTDEIPTPFQRICPLADCGNAFGRNAEPTDITFMNTDLTLVLQRDPVGEWLGSQSVGYWEPNGIGLADALLFDEQGVVGRALQTLILRQP
ncbi:MAG: thioesterase family protein [Granulosicoccus sp.]